MGTRNLTAVYLDGGYKVAQYGQWDGYPSGQGLTCLRFCKGIEHEDMLETFKEKCRAAKWITDEEIKQINEAVTCGALKNWTKEYPELSRDTGAEVLPIIYSKEPGIKLRDNLDFAADSLFCEWAWVIDLDRGTFEAYEGFNQEPLTEDDRFYSLKEREDGGYHGVKKVAEWSLDALPTEEEFLAAFKEEE